MFVKRVRDFLGRRLFKRDEEREDGINASIAAIVNSISMPIVAVLFVTISAQRLDIQQAIDPERFQRSEKHGIRFAYPTQTVYLGGPQRCGRRVAGSGLIPPA